MEWQRCGGVRVRGDCRWRLKESVERACGRIRDELEGYVEKVVTILRVKMMK